MAISATESPVGEVIRKWVSPEFARQGRETQPADPDQDLRGLMLAYSDSPAASRASVSLPKRSHRVASRDGESSSSLAQAHACLLGSWPLRTMLHTIIPQVTAHPAAGMNAQAPAPTTTRRTVSPPKIPQSTCAGDSSLLLSWICDTDRRHILEHSIGGRHRFFVSSWPSPTPTARRLRGPLACC